GYNKLMSNTSHGGMVEITLEEEKILEKISVCLVDDNKVHIELMEDDSIEQGDVEVIGTASNGKERSDMLEQLDPDVLILDIIMTHIDGLGVLHTLREREVHQNVIMHTAFGQEEVMKKAVDLGASYFILKPFDLDNLASQIRQVQGTNIS